METFILKCTNGILEVYEDKVVISRKSVGGFITQSLKGDKTFFYSDLTGVEYRKPTIMANGYIKFIASGTQETNHSIGKLGMTTADAAKDPNALILRAFNKEVPNKEKGTNNISNADEIMKFKQLLDQGIISQEEFDKKKQELLK